MEVDLSPVTETPKGFPGVNGIYCSMLSKQYLAAAHPTGVRVTGLKHHRRGRHAALLGAVVDQQVGYKRI